MNFKKILILVSMTSLVSCSSVKKSVGIGAGSGAAIGYGVASSASAGSILTGTLAGAGVGGIVAYFIHKALEDRDAKTRRNTIFNLEKYDVSKPSRSRNGGPMISKPVVDSFWVDEQIQGNKLIEAHRVWVIEENSRFVPEDR